MKVPRKSERDISLGSVSVRSLPDGTTFSAHALDLSKTGLSLFADQFLAVGQPVELVVGFGAAGGFEFLGRVVNARIGTEGNVLGIAFARPLIADEFRFLKARLADRAAGTRTEEGKGSCTVSRPLTPLPSPTGAFLWWRFWW